MRIICRQKILGAVSMLYDVIRGPVPAIYPRVAPPPDQTAHQWCDGEALQNHLRRI